MKKNSEQIILNLKKDKTLVIVKFKGIQPRAYEVNLFINTFIIKVMHACGDFNVILVAKC